jgi:dihydrofolate synthase/folylpolyglutamate synthase
VNDALSWLESLQGSGIRPGLQRMRALLRGLRNPHRGYPTIIVAGTNGKGSTSATLEAILRASGYRTAFYSSPHLIDFRERWLLDGAMIDEPLLRGCIVELRAAAGRIGITPTYFEALTLIAFIAFAHHQVDAAVLEVGMGGRLDATNVTRPRAALISSIGLDHTEWLGRTIRRIAREKAGVVHRRSIVLTSNADPCVLDVVRERSSRFGCPLHVTPAETTAFDVEEHAGGQRFTLRTPVHTYRLDTPLRGDHQIENIALAVRTAEELAGEFSRVDAGSIGRGVAATRWRGRLERIDLGPKTVWVDGAHNAHAMRRIASFAAEHLPSPRTLVFGIMGDKDIEEVADAIFPLFDRVVTTVPYPPRSAPAADLAALAGPMGIHALSVPEPEEAMQAALAGDARSILVCGSLYLAGAALTFLDRQTAGREARKASAETAHAAATS